MFQSAPRHPVFHSTKTDNSAPLQIVLNSKLCLKDVNIILDQAMLVHKGIRGVPLLFL